MDAFVMGAMLVLLYPVPGLALAVGLFRRTPMSEWLYGKPLAFHYLILLAWPLALPLCAWLAHRWWRGL